MSKSAISSEYAPAPFGPYSQGLRIGALVQVSGQVGIDRAMGALAGDTAYLQTLQAVRNVTAILEEAGLGLSDLLMLRIQASAPEDFPAINEALADTLVPPYPARTTLFGGLPTGILVEVDGLAVSQND